MNELRKHAENESPILQRFVELDASQFIETPDGQRIIEGVVFSTEDIDSHRSIIRQDGWDLARYATNPVLDWMHASTGYGKPSPDDLIGQARNVKVEGTRLGGDLHFASDELSSIAGKVFKQMKAGLLKGLSVAFMPKQVAWKLLMPDGTIKDEPPNTPEGDVEFYALMKAGARDLTIIERAELTAIGVVMVPSNPNTLANGIAQLRAARPARATEEEVMRRSKDAAARSVAEENQTMDQTVPATDPAPAPPPAAEREISDEIKTAAMKAASIAAEAVTAASKALSGEDEAAAKTACEQAYDACEACAHAFGAVVPEYVKAKEAEEHKDDEPDGDEDGEDGEDEKAHASVWARELTGHEDESAQRGTVEAWKKSHAELTEARAQVAALQAELAKATTATRSQQVAALLDAASRKLTPAERKSYEARGYDTDADIAWLRAHLDTLTERAELAPPTAQPAIDPVTLTDEERKVAKMFGMTPEQFAAHKRTLEGDQREDDDDER